jgi:hypothetical protein
MIIREMCFKIDDAFVLPHGVTIPLMKSRMIMAKVATERLEVGLG